MRNKERKWQDTIEEIFQNVLFSMNLKLICLNQRGFDDDEGENSQEREEMIFS